MMNKKADANMWWIIIGALLALIVMVLLIVMFKSGSDKTGKGFNDCGSKGGECMTLDKLCTNSDGSSGSKTSAFSCEKKDTVEQVCCFTS